MLPDPKNPTNKQKRKIRWQIVVGAVQSAKKWGELEDQQIFSEENYCSTYSMQKSVFHKKINIFAWESIEITK